MESIEKSAVSHDGDGHLLLPSGHALTSSRSGAVYVIRRLLGSGGGGRVYEAAVKNGVATVEHPSYGESSQRQAESLAGSNSVTESALPACDRVTNSAEGTAAEAAPQRMVALKVVRNHPAYTEQALLEIRLLQRLHATARTPSSTTTATSAASGSDAVKCGADEESHAPRSGASTDAALTTVASPISTHVVELLDQFICTVRAASHVCIVFELLPSTLLDAVVATDYGGLPLAEIRSIAKGMFAALARIHAAGVVHGDVKPENIMFARRAGVGAGVDAASGLSVPSVVVERSSTSTSTAPSVKLIDLGSAFMDEVRDVNYMYNFYIQSRYYRAPEVSLGLPYGTSIDMWSSGCVLAELFVGIPIFPGSCELDLWQRIVQLIGPPPDWMIEATTRSRAHGAPSSAASRFFVRRRTSASASPAKSVAPIAVPEAAGGGDDGVEHIYPLAAARSTVPLSPRVAAAAVAAVASLRSSVPQKPPCRVMHAASSFCLRPATIEGESNARQERQQQQAACTTADSSSKRSAPSTSTSGAAETSLAGEPHQLHYAATDSTSSAGATSIPTATLPYRDEARGDVSVNPPVAASSPSRRRYYPFRSVEALVYAHAAAKAAAAKAPLAALPIMKRFVDAPVVDATADPPLETGTAELVSISSEIARERSSATAVVGVAQSGARAQFSLRSLAYFVDFLLRLIVYDPRDRLTAAQALAHPFIILGDADDKAIPAVIVDSPAEMPTASVASQAAALFSVDGVVHLGRSASAMRIAVQNDSHIRQLISDSLAPYAHRSTTGVADVGDAPFALPAAAAPIVASRSTSMLRRHKHYVESRQERPMEANAMLPLRGHWYGAPDAWLGAAATGADDPVVHATSDGGSATANASAVTATPVPQVAVHTAANPFARAPTAITAAVERHESTRDADGEVLSRQRRRSSARPPSSQSFYRPSYSRPGAPRPSANWSRNAVDAAGVASPIAASAVLASHRRASMQTPLQYRDFGSPWSASRGGRLNAPHALHNSYASRTPQGDFASVDRGATLLMPFQYVGATPPPQLQQQTTPYSGEQHQQQHIHWQQHLQYDDWYQHQQRWQQLRHNGQLHQIPWQQLQHVQFHEQLQQSQYPPSAPRPHDHVMPPVTGAPIWPYAESHQPQPSRPHQQLPPRQLPLPAPPQDYVLRNSHGASAWPSAITAKESDVQYNVERTDAYSRNRSDSTPQLTRQQFVQQRGSYESGRIAHPVGAFTTPSIDMSLHSATRYSRTSSSVSVSPLFPPDHTAPNIRSHSSSYKDATAGTDAFVAANGSNRSDFGIDQHHDFPTLPRRYTRSWRHPNSSAWDDDALAARAHNVNAGLAPGSAAGMDGGSADDAVRSTSRADVPSSYAPSNAVVQGSRLAVPTPPNAWSQAHPQRANHGVPQWGSLHGDFPLRWEMPIPPLPVPPSALGEDVRRDSTSMSPTDDGDSVAPPWVHHHYRRQSVADVGTAVVTGVEYAWSASSRETDSTVTQAPVVDNSAGGDGSAWQRQGLATTMDSGVRDHSWSQPHPFLPLEHQVQHADATTRSFRPMASPLNRGAPNPLQARRLANPSFATLQLYDERRAAAARLLHERQVMFERQQREFAAGSASGLGRPFRPMLTVSEDGEAAAQEEADGGAATLNSRTASVVAGLATATSADGVVWMQQQSRAVASLHRGESAAWEEVGEY